MLPDTATALEVVRTVIALCGTLAALVALRFAVGDYLLLHREGIDGPTTIVYAQKIVGALIFLVVQVAYATVGAVGMLAPPPIPREAAAILNEISAHAAVSIASYLEFAGGVSIFVSSVVLLGSLWQFTTRHLLLQELRRSLAETGAASAHLAATEQRADDAEHRVGVADVRVDVADRRTDIADRRVDAAERDRDAT